MTLHSPTPNTYWSITMERTELAELIRQDWDTLRRIAYRQSRGTDRDDLFQASLERALKSAHRFDGQYLRAWFGTIVRNTKYKIAERADRQAAAYQRAGDLGLLWGRDRPVTDPTPISDDLAAALAALPDHHRDVIQAVAIDGLSYAVTADRLNIPVGTVMSRYARARRSLQQRLAA